MLFGIQLHDELFLDRQWDVLTGRPSDHASHSVFLIQGEPFQEFRTSPGLEALFHPSQTSRFGSYGHLVPNRHHEAGHIDCVSIHFHVTMANELACSSTTGRKSHPEDDVVQPRFKGNHQVIAGDPGLNGCFFEEIPELLLSKALNPLNLLLLPELHRVVRLLPASGLGRAMLPRRISPPLNRTLLGVAFGALKKELLALSPAELANRSVVACHPVARSSLVSGRPFPPPVSLCQSFRQSSCQSSSGRFFKPCASSVADNRCGARASHPEWT